MWKIKRNLTESIFLASKNTLPNEFFGLISGKDETLKELVLIPGTVMSQHYSLFYPHLLPVDFSLKGTIHSHTGYSNLPSNADLRTFSRYGKINFIVCKPFNLNSLKAFNLKGIETEFEVID
ncbi:MAG: Mov34/MPN/PAD-1 family protein [archaeon]